PRTGLWGPVAVSLLSAVDGAKRCGSLRVSRRAFSRSGNGEAVRSTPSPRPGGRLGVKRPLVALHLATLLLPEAAPRPSLVHGRVRAASWLSPDIENIRRAHP